MQPATEKQVDYLSLLFVDCNMTLAQRKGWLELRFDKTLLDSLTKGEASKAIAELIELKEGR